MRAFRLFAPGRFFCSGFAVLAAASACGVLASGEGAQRVVLADFEDVGTWRLTGSSGLAPGAWFAGSVFLGGSRVAAANGEHGGEIRYRFDEESGAARRLSFRREKMRRITGFIDGIEFDADARGRSAAVRFMLMDSAKKRFSTAAARIDGEGWRRHRVEVNAETVKNFSAIKFPVLVDEIVFTLDAGQPAEGAVFLDDIAATGAFTRSATLAIRPVYDGLAHSPGSEVKARYRLRSALPESVRRVVRWTVDESGGGRVVAQEREVELSAFGEVEVEFSAGTPAIGAYEAELRVEHSGVEVTYQDTFAVFAPNGRRVNRSPMWFGVQDNTVWQAEEENRLHLGWMRELGVDLNRLGTTSGRFRPDRPLSLEGWRFLLEPIAEAGIDTALMFFESPPELAPASGVRGAPTDMAAFETYAETYGRFFAGFPGVRYVEFWNEPDIGFFRGTTEEYLAMFSAFSRGMRRGAPDIRIGTGGVTVIHPRQKPDFSRRMYQESGDDYDVALFHAHGPFGNYVERQRLVEGWLAGAGLERPIANTESGERSGYNPDGRRRQAAELVKKMAYSKSRPGSEFHVWFTLQDYWDMDPDTDDSFGLVTSDNRVKPAFVAYNEVIRRLANTRPAADWADGDAAAHSFVREDGASVSVAWPAAGRTGGVLRVRAGAETTVVNMYGRTLETIPAGAIRALALGPDPVFVESAAMLGFLRREEGSISADPEVYRDAGASTVFSARLRHDGAERLKGRVKLIDAAGTVLWERLVELAAGESLELGPVIPPAAAGASASEVLLLRLQAEGVEGAVFDLPIRAAESLVIPRVEAGMAGGLGERAALVKLDEAKAVFELSYDPAIPAWRGPADLSVTARFAHDGENLRLRFEVKDDRHAGPTKEGELWRADSVQLAFYNPASSVHVLLDMGLVGDAPVVWCHRGEVGEDAGRWAVPVEIRRVAATTIYELSLPFSRLGFAGASPAAGTPFRLSFLVNEDDGQGRVRWMRWAGGLGDGQDVRQLGHVILK